MRSLGNRFSKLREKLLKLRCGPGAAILPPEVVRIHMEFALKMNRGHMGPRKIWREYLPSLKYHNPAVPMIVNRHDQQKTAPVMTIYMRDQPTTSTADSDTSSSTPPSAAPSTASQPQKQLPSSINNLSKAPPAGPGERVVRIEMGGMRSKTIWEALVAETRARALPPTKEDAAEMQAAEAQRKQAEIDRERNRIIKLELKKEQEMLKRAREAGGMGETEEA